jgi:hypothetical protein
LPSLKSLVPLLVIFIGAPLIKRSQIHRTDTLDAQVNNVLLRVVKLPPVFEESRRQKTLKAQLAILVLVESMHGGYVLGSRVIEEIPNSLQELREVEVLRRHDDEPIILLGDDLEVEGGTEEVDAREIGINLK